MFGKIYTLFWLTRYLVNATSLWRPMQNTQTHTHTPQPLGPRFVLHIITSAALENNQIGKDA